MHQVLHMHFFFFCSILSTIYEAGTVYYPHFLDKGQKSKL